tara:strand:+ start:322 stop:843 length:522 start_codon:yes stop_codon:yes gene_type:complete
MKKIIYIFLFLAGVFISNALFAENIHFLDYRYILNESVAGKKAQSELKKKLDKNIKTIQNKEKSIREEEKKIIQQKKIISPEEYKKKINDLRKKVSSLQNERNKILSSVANERAKAKNKLLENLNPILSDYMAKNNIKIILDKKNLIRADNSLDITKQIVELLNKKIKSIKIN